MAEPGQLIVCGLPGTGKTLVAEVLLSLGWNFGSRLEMNAVSLERDDVGKLSAAVCERYEFLNEGTQRFNAIYTLYNPRGNEDARHVCRSVAIAGFPEAFKVVHVASLPVLFELFQTGVAVWCWRAFEGWVEQVVQTEFFYRRTVPPKPNLWAVYHLAHETFQEACQLVGTQPVYFDVDTKRFTGRWQSFEAMGLTEQMCNNRLQALMVETGGRIGMNGRWAPDDPNNFPKLRSSTFV